MKWRKTKNPDLIDQRGGGGGRAGGFPMPTGKAGAGGLGIAGIIIFILIQVLGGGGGGGSGGGFEIPGGFGSQVQAPGAEDPQAIPPKQDPQLELKQFSSYVQKDAQDMWEGIFEQQGAPYERAKLVLYDGGVDTGCGSATSAVGPFYCPADQGVYLDLSFYQQMSDQLGAPGDFAWAYVIAHEMGHHVQQQEGTSDRVHSEEQRSSEEDANELSVRLELQADCYSGVWAKTVFAEGALEQGDIEEAFGAAEAVGDDRLQQKSGGGIDPDSFTHGTSEQRRKWFTTGYESGEPASCDTFSPDEV